MKSSTLILAIVAWSKRVGADTAAETAGESPARGQAQRGANAASPQDARRCSPARLQASRFRRPPSRRGEAARLGPWRNRRATGRRSAGRRQSAHSRHPQDRQCGQQAGAAKGSAIRSSVQSWSAFAIPPRCTGTGRQCLLVGEISLQGVVRSPSGFIAVVMNGEHTYFLRENDPLADGAVERITNDAIILRQRSSDALGRPVTREVTKKLGVPAA